MVLLLTSLSAIAHFYGKPSLEKQVEKSEYILMVRVSELLTPFEEGQEADFKGGLLLGLARCEVVSTIKAPDRSTAAVWGHIMLAHPVGHATLKEGQVYIVFCSSSGLVPTVLNDSWIRWIGSGKEPDKKVLEKASKFVGEIEALIRTRKVEQSVPPKSDRAGG